MGIMDIFAQLEKSSGGGGKPEFLIAGLGNPGLQYENTRHNAGFIALDYIAAQEQISVTKYKFKGNIGDGTIAGKRCLLLKPQTFMNKSGEAVEAALQFYKLEPEQLIVLFDDISLAPGKLRIRRKGSAGGHNGIKSIIELTGSEDFARVKLGIGAKPNKSMDLADWVLSKFRPEDKKALDEAAANAYECVRLMVQGRTDEAMNKYNA
jgi:PTH1 family peptidyl-tRNA hydrolase